ncbi:MAG TPA: hypothetical protein VJ947_06375 [Pseudohaliea sp.]|nr:hypothetical protein [Pseudohaliea sp.]
MTGGGEDPGLYLDAEGLPILFDVVVAGDFLHSAGYGFGHWGARGAPAGPGSALEQAAGADPALPPEAASDLERRIREAVQAALPRAAEQAVRNLRRSVGRDPEADRPRSRDD